MLAPPKHVTARPAALAQWLFVVAAMVFAMVVVGGITRLTESGLSITEWKPISGAIPPLNRADWDTAFAAYQQTTQYKEIAGPAGMTLRGFQFIFFWEWVHRLLGRLIGLAFALPLAWFWMKKQIPAGYKPRLVGLFILGGLQGAVGWFMVVSGLEGRTEVSPYRLSAHLMFALFLFAALVWTALDFRQMARDPASRPARLSWPAAIVLAIVFVQLMLGAWVAGFRAGYVSNSWPLMNGSLVPEGIDWSRGVPYAMTHDPYLIHFEHRWWAWIAVAALVVLARKARPIERKASIAIHTAFGAQILFGIATVMSGIAIWLAVIHQAVGALVVAASAWGAHVIGRQPSGGWPEASGEGRSR